MSSNTSCQRFVKCTSKEFILTGLVVSSRTDQNSKNLPSLLVLEINIQVNLVWQRKSMVRLKWKERLLGCGFSIVPFMFNRVVKTEERTS